MCTTASADYGMLGESSEKKFPLFLVIGKVTIACTLKCVIFIAAGAGRRLGNGKN